jgi:hypothetical protein
MAILQIFLKSLIYIINHQIFVWKQPKNVSDVYETDEDQVLN